MKLEHILAWLEEIAPVDSAEDFDNVGLLIGSPNTEVHKVLIGMDLTEDMADTAIATGAELILTHHPFLFHSIKHIDTETIQGRTIAKVLASGIAVVAAHTNLDKAQDGIGDSLADLLQLKSITSLDNYIRAGYLDQDLTVNKFAEYCSGLLGAQVRCYPSLANKRVRCVAVAGGAYGEGYYTAYKNGADAYVVGEIHHHELIDALQLGLHVIDAGHHYSEWPGVCRLYERMQQHTISKKWPIEIALYRSPLF